MDFKEKILRTRLVHLFHLLIHNIENLKNNCTGQEVKCHAVHDRHDNKILRKSHISDDGWFPKFSLSSRG